MKYNQHKHFFMLHIIAYVMLMQIFVSFALAQPSQGETPPETSPPAQPSGGEPSEPPAEEPEELAEPIEEPLIEVESEDPDDGSMIEVSARASNQDIFDQSGTVQTLDARELERLPLDDPGAVLSRVAGVYVRSEDGFGLRPNIGMRGVNSDRSSRITLMEDGVLFGPAPYSAPAAYYFPLMIRMTNIDVVRGPPALRHGPSTIGGAINFQSRAVPEEASGRAEFWYGMFRSRRAHLWYGASSTHAGFLVEAADLGSEGFRDIDYTDRDTGFHRGEYVLRGFVRSSPSAHVFQKLELKLGFSFESSNQTYLGLTENDFEENYNRAYVSTSLDHFNAQRYQIELNHRVVIGTEIEIDTTAYRHDYHRVWNRLDGFVNGPSLFDIVNQPDAAAYESWYEILTGESNSTIDPSTRSDDTLIIAGNNRRFASYGIQSRFRYHRAPTDTHEADHHLEIGMRLHADSIERVHTAQGYLMQNQALIHDDFDDPISTDNRANAFAFSAHAAYVMTFNQLRINPLLRTEVIRTQLTDHLTNTSQNNAMNVLLPGLSVSYEVKPWLTTFMGVHRGFSPMNPGQGDEVNPESSINYEGGFRFSETSRQLRAEITGFFNDYRSMLLSCSGSSGCPADALDTQFNAGSANVGGIEAQWSETFKLTDQVKLSTRVNYTWTMARFRDVASTSITTPGYEDADDGDNLPYIPQHQGQVQLGLDAFDRFIFTVTTRYYGRTRENAGRGDKDALFTDDYFMLDASGAYQLSERIRVVARAENLLQRQPIASRRPYGIRMNKPLLVFVGFQIDI